MMAASARIAPPRITPCPPSPERRNSYRSLMMPIPRPLHKLRPLRRIFRARSLRQDSDHELPLQRFERQDFDHVLVHTALAYPIHHFRRVGMFVAAAIVDMAVADHFDDG